MSFEKIESLGGSIFCGCMAAILWRSFGEVSQWFGTSLWEFMKKGADESKLDDQRIFAFTPNLHQDEVGEKDSVGVVKLFSGSAPMRPSVLRSNPHVLRFCLKIPGIHLIKYAITLKR